MAGGRPASRTTAAASRRPRPPWPSSAMRRASWATADDLSHLSTLGFRGEALASIASVAQVALLTRSRNEETGTLIRMAEGREISREPWGGPPGTLVTVEHLFANVPARLKFLKQSATEAAHIQQIVTRYALRLLLSAA